MSRFKRAGADLLSQTVQYLVIERRDAVAVERS